MAHANKRITVTLIIVAFLFILTIILLIIPYKSPSYSVDTSNSDKHNQDQESTSKSSTSMSTSTSTEPSTSKSPPTKIIGITSASSVMSSTTHSSSSYESFASTELQDINGTTSGPTEEDSTTSNYTDSTDSYSKTTSYEVLSDVSETTDMTRETEVEMTDLSDVTTSTAEYNESSSEHTTSSDDKDETLSTNYSTDITGSETTDESPTYSSQYIVSDSYTTSDSTTTMELSEGSENPTTIISAYSTSLSTEESTITTEDSTSLSTETTSVESTTLSTYKNTSPKYNTNTCENAVCKQMAARMLDLMNHTVDPCQDFYQYSCGNGVDNAYLSPVNPRDAAMSRIKEAVLTSKPENLAHVLYDSCLDKTTSSPKERIAYLTDLVLELGEIDFRPDMNVTKLHLYNYIDDKDFNFTVVLAKMMKHHFTPLFDMTLDVDDRNTSQFILKLTPPLFQSPFSENIIQYTCLDAYYQKMAMESTIDLDDMYENYKYCKTDGAGNNKYGESVLKSVKKMDLANNVTEEFVEKVEKSIAFEVADVYAEEVLKEFPNSGEIRQNLINRKYTLYTLQEMDDDTERGRSGKKPIKSSYFSWQDLVQELLDRSVDPSTTYVQVYFPEQMSEVMAILNENDDELAKLRNILLAVWSQYLHNNLIEPVGHTPHTEEYCLSLVTKLLPDVTTQLYLSSFDVDSLKIQNEKVKELKKFITEAFISRFTDKSNSTTEKIKQKLTSMKLDIGEELLEDLPEFSVIEELKKDDFPRNVIQLLNRNRRILYSLYDKNPSNSSIMWLQSNLPYHTSGSTSYPLNTVLIPIGSVESPFYEHEGPDFINFAGLGQMVSQEIMHAFDSTGVKFELENDTNIVNPSKQCQNEQLKELQTFIINDVSLTATLPVELVVNEALSDSNAVHMAWEAYLTTKKAGRSHRKRRASKSQRKGAKSNQVAKLSEAPNTSYNYEVLPWLDPNPIKQFYIRSAQMHCEKSSSINLIHLKENEHLHGSLRVNHMARNDPLFHEAFRCPNNSPMKKDRQCSYIPLNDS